MAAYQTTWGQNNTEPNVLTARSLNSVSSNLSEILTGEVNGSFDILSGGTNTTYTVSGTKPTLVVMAVSLAGAAAGGLAGLQAGAPATVQWQVRDPATGVNTLTTIATFRAEGAGALNLPAAVTGTCCGIYLFNSGGQYRLNSPSGSVTVISRYEFHFNNFHAHVPFTHNEIVNSISTGKWANYLNRVKRAILTDGSIAQTAAGTANNTDYNQAEMTFANLSITGAAGTLQQRNLGQGYQTVFNRVISDHTSSFPLVINAGGAYRSSGGTINAASRVNQLPIGPAVTFTSGESGVATGNKLRNLDRRARGGVDHTQTWTRVNRGAGVNSVTPSATKWTIVVATSTSATASLLVNGTTVSSVAVGRGTSDHCLFAIVGPGDSYSGTGTLSNRFEWTVPGLTRLSDV